MCSGGNESSAEWRPDVWLPSQSDQAALGSGHAGSAWSRLGNARVPDFQAKVESEAFQNLVAATVAAAVEKFRPLYERP
jgi:hypothetical protein